MGDFFVELLLRLFSDKPWFFKVIQIVSAVIAVVLLGPSLVDALTGAGVSLPQTWLDFVAKAVGVAGVVSIFIAQLTMKTKDKTNSGVKD